MGWETSSSFLLLLFPFNRSLFWLVSHTVARLVHLFWGRFGSLLVIVGSWWADFYVLSPPSVGIARFLSLFRICPSSVCSFSENHVLAPYTLPTTDGPKIRDVRFLSSTPHSTRHATAMPLALFIFVARQFLAKKSGSV
jgi:hypothetical protein